MVACDYSSPDGPPSTRGPLSTAADFRRLTPVVVMRALARAGTAVCEPIVRARLEIPTETIGAVLAVLSRHGPAGPTPSSDRELSTIEAVLPAARLPDVQRRLAGLTGGEGVLEASFAGYQPVRGDPPTRVRTTPNPLNWEEYLMHLAGLAGRR
jgi:ribosomal protection tetracycline resistance protein